MGSNRAVRAKGKCCAPAPFFPYFSLPALSLSSYSLFFFNSIIIIVLDWIFLLIYQSKMCSRIEIDDINVDTKSKGFKTCYALRKMGSGNESQLDNICWKKCWVWEVSLAVCAFGERDPNSDTL